MKLVGGGGWQLVSIMILLGISVLVQVSDTYNYVASAISDVNLRQPIFDKILIANRYAIIS